MGCTSDKVVTIDHFPVKMGEKWGYIDREGKYVINPQYDVAYGFNEGKAMVKTSKGWAFIEEKPNATPTMAYADALPYSEGVAWTVKDGNAPALLDMDGNTLFEMKSAKYVYQYSEGLAYAKLDSADKYGYIDKKGNWAIEPQFGMADFFSEGLACVANYIAPGETGEHKYGYVDKDGKLVIGYMFDGAASFNANGTAVVGVNSDKDGWRYGLINRKGEYMVNPQFSSLSAYDGFGYVCKFADGDTYGWCDSNGKILINPQFKFAGGFFGSDLSVVSPDGETYGYIDKNGKMIINPQFEEAMPFMDGMAFVKQGGKWGIIDETGHYTVNPQFDSVNPLIMVDYVGKHVDIPLRSRYFNASIYSSLLLSFVKDRQLAEMLDMGIGAIGAKNYFDSTRVSVGDTEVLFLEEDNLLENSQVAVSVCGNFYEEVSDGWFDTVNRFVASKKPTSIKIKVNIEGMEAANHNKVYESIKKDFLDAIGAGSKAGAIGGCAAEIEMFDSEINIVLKKNKFSLHY